MKRWAGFVGSIFVAMVSITCGDGAPAPAKPSTVLENVTTGGAGVVTSSSATAYPRHDRGLGAPIGAGRPTGTTTIGTSGTSGTLSNPPDGRFRTTPQAGPVRAGDLWWNPELDGTISGQMPLSVTFNMCPSTDPDAGTDLKFTFDFDGDGQVDARGSCRASHTYTIADLLPARGYCQSPNSPAEICVSDRSSDESHEQCRQYVVCGEGLEEEVPPAPPAACVPLPAGTFAGSLDPTDPTIPERLFRDAIPSTCAGKAFPGTFSVANVYETHTFRNEGTEAACVRVNYDEGTCATNGHASAYLGGFNPANLAAGYVGDVGSSFTQPFDVTIPGQTDFIIVVHSNAGIPSSSCGYSFTLVNTDCP